MISQFALDYYLKSGRSSQHGELITSYFYFYFLENFVRRYYGDDLILLINPNLLYALPYCRQVYKYLRFCLTFFTESFWLCFLVGITIPPYWFITITIAIWTFAFIGFYSIRFCNRIVINISVIISNIDRGTFITIVKNVNRVNKVWISRWFICSGNLLF